MSEKRISNVIAFTWYRREEYLKLLEHAEDSDELHDTYKAWLSDARHALVKYKRMGFDPRRVYLEVDDMLEWCELRDKSLNSRAREMYKEIRRQQFYRQFDELMEQIEALDGSDAN
ncbi:MAG: hypothetical protein ACQEVA_02800 [Myxococcota bacterium]